MVGNSVRIIGNQAYISRYEVMEAFFRTEEEENEDMAVKLNEMINIFCDEERKTKRNVLSLPFEVNLYENIIEYINSTIQN
ncbi:MAG: hypothetical protein IJZ64_07860 [Ruminococcus sp.]|nr:hypothetical protein [Ruminococcus sp.]